LAPEQSSSGNPSKNFVDSTARPSQRFTLSLRYDDLLIVSDIHRAMANANALNELTQSFI
jgi:hypothetical protein